MCAGEAEDSGVIMTGILQDQQQIEMAISTGRALVACGHAMQALQFCERVVDLFVRCGVGSLFSICQPRSRIVILLLMLYVCCD